MAGTQRIQISHFSGHRVAVRLIEKLMKFQADGVRRVILDCAGAGRLYANGLVPAAAVIDHFRQSGMTLDVVSAPDRLSRWQFPEPARATKEGLKARHVAWNTLWRYEDSQDIYALSEAIVDDVHQRIQFGSGVLEALSWCLYEVLDNVLIHARTGRGFMMAQYLRESRTLLIAVADAGIGIHRSFVEGAGGYRPPYAVDALRLAVAQWTSSTGEKRGNGLYGLAEVVAQNGGTLDIRSGKAWFRGSPAGKESVQLSKPEWLVIDADHHSTLIDFQLNVAEPVDLGGLLGMEIVNTHLEDLIDDGDEYVIPMKKYAEYVVTREGAKRLHVRLINYLAEGAPGLILDFSDMRIVGSSFADETIARLVQHYGLDEFRRKFFVRNASPAVQGIISRAMYARASDLPADESAEADLEAELEGGDGHV